MKKGRIILPTNNSAAEGTTDHHTWMLTSCTLAVRISYFYTAAVKFSMLCSLINIKIPSLYSLLKCLTSYWISLF